MGRPKPLETSGMACRQFEVCMSRCEQEVIDRESGENGNLSLSEGDCFVAGTTRRRFCAGAFAMSLMSSLGSVAFADKQKEKAKPFVKWAGGKGQLIAQLEELLPSDFAERKRLTYVEPFVGGGAMMFHLLAKYKNISRVIINDFNSDLIGCYNAIRDTPKKLIGVLSDLRSEYRAFNSESERKQYYLERRNEYNQRNENKIRNAALFIFLNRTCFNGLYRVNSKGLYNVPFGRAANPMICDEETIFADSELLQNVEILNGDFEGVHKHVKDKAFFYFDPPYRPLPNTPSFTSYSKDGFNDTQQRRLAAFCRKLDAEGHQWLLSNSDPSNTDSNDRFFEEVYEGFDIRRVSASRMINSKVEGRGKITELAIRNYRG